MFNSRVLEDVNSLFQTGFIPTIFKMDEWDGIKSEVKLENTTMDSYIEHFKKNCFENIHLFLNISPMGVKIREYSRNYPNIINYSTVVYFNEWPESALIDVAKYYLDFSIGSPAETDAIKVDVADVLAQIHLSVFQMVNKVEKESKRKSYFTSSNYINLIKTFNHYMKIKQNFIKDNILKYKSGLVSIYCFNFRLKFRWEKKKLVI